MPAYLILFYIFFNLIMFSIFFLNQIQKTRKIIFFLKNHMKEKYLTKKTKLALMPAYFSF